LENDNSVGAVQVRSKWAFFLLAAVVGLFGQRADAMRTPLTDIRAAITQPQQLTAPAADAATPADAPNQVRDASTWLVESITPLGHTDDGQPIALISLLIPTAHLAEHTPALTRAGPYAAPETHTRVFYIGQPPLGLFSYEHALAYLVNDCNLTEELAEQVLDQRNDKTGKYSWEEIAEGIRTGRIKFSGNMDIDCDESYKRASPTRSNVPVTDRFAGSVPDPFGSFYPDKQDTPVPSAFDEARASGSYNNIPQIVVDNPELARLWLFTEAGNEAWRSITAAILASASGQERNRQKEAEQVAANSLKPSIGHSTPWTKMTQAERKAFKHSYSRHGKELGLPNWSEKNAAALQKQFNDVTGYIRQNGTQLPGPIQKPWNGQNVEVNFFKAEFHGTTYYYYEDAVSGTFISAGKAR
jgi:hypothetical protein